VRETRATAAATARTNPVCARAHLLFHGQITIVKFECVLYQIRDMDYIVDYMQCRVIARLSYKDSLTCFAVDPDTGSARIGPVALCDELGDMDIAGHSSSIHCSVVSH